MRDELEALRRRVEQLEHEVSLLKTERSVEHPMESKQDATQVEHLPTEEVRLKSPLATNEEKESKRVDQVQEKVPVTAAQSMQQEKVASTREPIDFERLLGKWLPRMFMFILLLGVLWGLKVASDYGLLTDAFRIVGGYGATVLLYFLGMKYMRQGHTIFGGTLLGGIIAIGMLTTFAAHYLYGYFPVTIAMFIGIGYVVFGVWLSNRTKIEVLTLFSAIAGFLLPYLLEEVMVNAPLFYSYILLLFLSLFYVSIKEQHKYTFYLTFLLFHLTVFFNMLMNSSDHQRWLIVTVICIQHAAIVIFYLMRKIPRDVFTETLIYTNVLFAIGWFQMLTQTEQLWMYSTFAVIYIVLTYYVYRQKELQLASILSAVSVLAIAMFFVTLRLDDERMTILSLLITGTVSIWIGLKFESLRTLVSGAIVYGIPAVSVVGTFFIPHVFSIEHIGWLILLGSVILFFYTLYDSPPVWLHDQVQYFDRWLIAAQIVLLVYITRLVQLIVSQDVFVYHSEVTTRHVYFLVWMTVLVAMYQFYKWQHGKYIVHAACILYFLLGIPMVFSSIYTFAQGYLKQSVSFAFFVQLLYAGILVLIVIAILKKKFYWTSPKLAKTLPSWGFMLQIILFIFINKWYISIALYIDMQREFYFLLHTAILLIFTFVSISIGRLLTWKAVKYGGVFLLFMSIFKLFFIDLFAISILIRAFLFIGVGIGGLMYSKTLLKEQKRPENHHEQ